jgi:hypothetical protein
VINTLNKFRRRVQTDVGESTNVTHKSGKRLNPAALPSTQDAIAVVAGIGFGSMNDALLADESIDARHARPRASGGDGAVRSARDEAAIAGDAGAWRGRLSRIV